MIGTATRSSISLGLHLRATHNKLDASALEARHKLWWSIFILENLLSVMTGRASGLWNSYLSAPPPLASKDMDPFTNSGPKAPLERLSENPPMKWTMNQQYERLKAQRALMKTMDVTNELYFFCLADLIVISHTASIRVYNTDSVKQGWDEIESRIDFYNSKMVDWRSGLPDSISFEVINSGPNLSTKDAYRVSLAMHYHSSRIILNRPCLTRKKKDGKKDVKNHISRARREIEMTCLLSALAILSIFPDEPGAEWLRRVPWWNALHFLVQATTVLLINISFDSSLQKQRSQMSASDSSDGQSLDSSGVLDPAVVRTAAKKGLLWLCHLGKNDDSARRAFELCNSCLRRIGLSCFVPDGLAAANNAPAAPHLDIPTDQTHQQHRSRFDVSHSQFAGTRGFGYDQNIGDATIPWESEDTENIEFVEPSVGNLGVDIDMPDHIPDPQNANLDDILQFLP